MSRSSAVEASSSSSFGAWERFNLLLLEDGEYYFRDYACYLWKDGRRVAGQLKVCSMSLYFVPRDIQEPVLRVPYKGVTAIDGLEDETMASGEGMFLVEATEKVEMKAGEVHRPYQRSQGEFSFRFSLVYTSLEEVLPMVEELCILGQQDGSKEERAEAKEQLDAIIREHEENERFNPGWLEDDNEKVVLEMIGNCITALCSQPGRVVLTQHRIYFQPFNVVSNAPIQTYQLDKVMFVMRRVYQLEDLGVEVFFPGKASLYLTLRSTAERDTFIKSLMQQPNLQLEHMRSRDTWTRGWVNGRISNFDYLMYLNREAGRSFKDLTQYPVFPWVIADYTSSTLDLTDPATFRDLTRPIGALNPDRLKGFKERYIELKKLYMSCPGAGKGGKGTLSLDFPPPFLYGCHYSSPGYVVFYLMRSDPQLMLRLQNGRFDAPDRLFWSIQDSWKSVLTLPTDVKELIPEFYSNDASFLVNNNEIDFGMRSNGQRVGDVVLPPWAVDAQDFVYKLAEALESPYVSSKLHKWINLVFGYKSRGPAAEAADNVFHYLTYDEIAAKYLAQEQDPVMREALRLQMMEFGRTPRQLFTKKHPKRRAGTNGLLACFACAPAQMRRPAQPVNTLLGKGWAGRNITPVSRAVFKLTSKKPARRAATLAWLEKTAATHEPGALVLRQGKGAELVLLVKFVRDAREGKNPHATGEEMTSVLVRSCKALAVAPQNRRYILDAGALDLLVDTLCSKQAELSLQALQALAAISKEEDDPHLVSVDRRALAKVMEYLGTAPQCEPMLAALTIVTHLARATPNRTYFTDHSLLHRRLLPIFESLSQPLLQQRPSLPGNQVLQTISSPPESPAALSSLQQGQQQMQQQSAPGSPEPKPFVAPVGGREASGTPAVPALALPPSPTARCLALSSPTSPQALQPGGPSLSTRRSTVLLRPHTPRAMQDAQRCANLRQCVLAMTALLQDDAQKDLVLAPASGSSSRSPASSQDGAPVHPADSDSSSSCAAGDDGGRRDGSSCALDLILALCHPAEQALTQAAAYECLAALTTYDPMRQQVKERRLFPMLLQAATSGPAQVQQLASAAVANVCADPQMAVAALPDQGGLAAMVAMALSPDREVQRHAARALWHLVAQPDTRGKVVRAGALPALLGLARAPKRGMHACGLARQALRVCHEDPATRPALEAAALAAGVEAEELAAFTASQSRISSHPSASNLQSGASPHAASSSSLGMGHRRQPSDLRSAGGDTEETATPSPGASRWPSFTAGNLAAGLAAGPGAGAAAAAGTLGQAPQRRGSAGEEAAAPEPACPQDARSPRCLSDLAPPLAGTAAGAEGAGAGAAEVDAPAADGPAASGGPTEGQQAPANGSLIVPSTDGAGPVSAVAAAAPSLGPQPTSNASSLPATAGPVSAATENKAQSSCQQQQQQQTLRGAGGSKGSGVVGSHAPLPQLELSVDCLDDGRDSPAPLPIISPVVQTASSSAGSSPRQRWEQHMQEQQQVQQRGESPSRHPLIHHPSGQVADVVKKLERMASHQSQPEAHDT